MAHSRDCLQMITRSSKSGAVFLSWHCSGLRGLLVIYVRLAKDYEDIFVMSHNKIYLPNECRHTQICQTDVSTKLLLNCILVILILT